jgi:hypothetical protein
MCHTRIGPRTEVARPNTVCSRTSARCRTLEAAGPAADGQRRLNERAARRRLEQAESVLHEATHNATGMRPKLQTTAGSKGRAITEQSSSLAMSTNTNPCPAHAHRHPQVPRHAVKAQRRGDVAAGGARVVVITELHALNELCKEEQDVSNRRRTRQKQMLW